MKSVFAILLVGAFLHALDLFAQSPAGLWTDQAKDTFELYGAETISGKIRSLVPASMPDGQTLTDIHNPDPARHKIPLIGLVFLRDFKPAGNAQWRDGTIYDPRSGKTYSCSIQMEGNDTLAVHGFIGLSLFGRTEHWRRLTP
jgi:uncharacterized protein (DUF2147 family)